MHVTIRVVSIDQSIFGSSLSLLPEVEASVKLFLASMNVSFARSNCTLVPLLDPCEPKHSLLATYLVVSCRNTTSEHDLYIQVLFTWLKPHHLQFLSWWRLECSFIVQPCYQCGAILHLMIKLGTI